MAAKRYKLVTRCGNSPFSRGSIPVEESIADPDGKDYTFDMAKDAILVIALALVKQGLDVKWQDNDRREVFNYSLHDHDSGLDVFYDIGIESI